jgi:hypothetical protein
MFQFKKDENGLSVRVSGETTEALQEIAQTLELDSQWPIIPLALNMLYHICRVHKETNEKLRDIVMMDSQEHEGTFLFDLEWVKVEGKKMEVQGLNSKGEKDDS